MEVESHPGVPLIDHLKAVALRCLQIGRSNNSDFGISQQTKELLLYVCGSFHDIGKATSYFQAYLKDPKMDHSQLKNHALPSALFVFFVIREIIEKCPPFDRKSNYFLAALCFVVVKRHHGHLRNFKNEMTLMDQKEILARQYAAIDPDVAQVLIDECLKNHKIAIKWKDFLGWFNSKSVEKEIVFEYLDFELDELNCWNDEQKSSAYYLFLWMFSALLNADRSDVILGDNNPTPSSPALEYLQKYRKENKFDAPISAIDNQKNEAYFSVLDRVEKTFAPNRHFYSITLPTGFGKTLTSLAAAIKIKTLIAADGGRIIMTIPFTSIIDQTFEVYQNVFGHPDNTLLLKHHHLAEPKYKDGEDSVRAGNEGSYLIETWQSGIVITTFVQLLECLITNSKSKLLKFPSLSNSVIVLDEVQQLPYHIWKLIRRSFFTVAENLNCYFILMSATQPLIFDPEEDEITELVPNRTLYFSSFNRTKIINRISTTISLTEFIDYIVKYSQENGNNDILVILNTKRVTLQCFRELRKRLGKTRELRYLTTLITPYERKTIIKELRNRESHKKYIIVSTQLVEAGVDISVDTVFRALAPFDSVMQATGRGNRYNKSALPSEIFLYKIEEQYNISCRLYGKELMLKTELVLGKTECTEEKDYLTLITHYYKEVKGLADYSDNKLLTNLLHLDFEDTGKFSLINEIECESVFIALNEDAKLNWTKFVETWEDKSLSFLDRKKQFNSIRSRFYDYVINVPIPYGQKDIGLPFESIHGFYLWEYDKNADMIYSYNSNDLSNNEGYVYNGLSSISY